MAMSDDQRFAMYTAEEIGNAIKKRRRQLKITQKEFAQRLDKSERTIQKYESGEITMKIDLIKQVAEELDIPWRELLEAKTENDEELTEKRLPSYHFHTMADVIDALFTITDITDISFQLSCTKPPENPEWTSALMIDGKGNGTYNADFCLFMENWMNKLSALQSGSLSPEQFDTWKNETLEYYSESYFSDAASQEAKSKNTTHKKKRQTSPKRQIVSTNEKP